MFKICLIASCLIALIGCNNKLKTPPQALDSSTTYVLAATQGMNAQQKSDFIRQYIHFNTLQADYDYVMPRDEHRLLEDLYAAHKTGKRVPLKCGYRTYIALKLFNSVGVQARPLGIWARVGEPGDYNHSLLETYNPGTGNWEISDPTYNAFYLLPNGNRASLIDMLTTPLTDITPSDNMQTGWSMINDDPAPGMNVQRLLDNEMWGLGAHVSPYHDVLINTARYNATYEYPNIDITAITFYTRMRYSVEFVNTP